MEGRRGDRARAARLLALRSGETKPRLAGSVAAAAGTSDVLRPSGTDIPADATEQWDLPYDLGATAAQRAEIRARIDAGQSPATNYGNPLYPYDAGLQSW